MAVRIDQDAIVKYADKAFLVVALAFLVFTAINLATAQATAVVTYREVESDYNRAVQRQKTADADLKSLLGIPENEQEANAEDLSVYRLLTSKPSYAALLESRHTGQAAGWDFSQGGLWVPYKTPRPPAARQEQPLRIPEKRIAPYLVLLIQDKAYLESGKEKQREFGRDILYVSGQAKVPLAQQTLWSRASAPGVPINSTLLTDYEVERREVGPDGSRAKWEPRQTVRFENVRRQMPVNRAAVGDPKALDPRALDADPRVQKAYVDAVYRLRGEFMRAQDQILRPPFWEMAGKEWLQPYEVLKVDESKLGGAAPAGVPPAMPGEWPVVPGGGFVPPPVPGAGELGIQPPVEAPPGGAKQDPEIWFTDELPITDVGKTYEYRVRVKFLNPIFGVLAGTLPEERYLVEVPGEWSEPSAAITLAPVVRFYFIGRFGPRANVQLHRWLHGEWYRVQSVTFDVGDSITFERPMDIRIPNKKGPIVLPNKEKVAFDANATVVDVLDTTVRVSGVLMSTEKLILRDHLGNRLESRLSYDDRNRLGTDWEKVQAEQKPIEKRRPVPTGPGPGEEIPYPPEEIPPEYRDMPYEPETFREPPRRR